MYHRFLSLFSVLGASWSRLGSEVGPSSYPQGIPFSLMMMRHDIRKIACKAKNSSCLSLYNRAAVLRRAVPQVFSTRIKHCPRRQGASDPEAAQNEEENLSQKSQQKPTNLPQLLASRSAQPDRHT